MDIVNKLNQKKTNSNRNQWIVAGGLLFFISLYFTFFSGPSLPTIAKDDIYLGIVKYGNIVIDVNAPGTLIPIENHWISSLVSGHVDQRLQQPGDILEKDTVIMVLSNPKLEQQLEDAELKLQMGVLNYNILKENLKLERLKTDLAIADAESDFKQTQILYQAQRSLENKNIVSKILVAQTRIKLEQTEIKLKLQKAIYSGLPALNVSKINVEDIKLQQLKRIKLHFQELVNALNIRTSSAGVLQDIVVQVGQLVTEGTLIARTAKHNDLKAQLRVQESQVKDIKIGQNVKIDTRNGIIQGKVARIDPSVQNSTVNIDVTLIGLLPEGVRTDLRIDGTIEIGNIQNIHYISKPTNVSPNNTVSIFKISEDDFAEKISVKFGRASASYIEVISGLSTDDQIILSDISEWEAIDKLRIN
ncbi:MULTISPECIES: efflux RND transporter periplasmic adaptor subunit [unclassified Colwellia]|uniref:efflux RND transporter periplasmic adaptor subunit n=1 Tax=unclassified Colwellia TaxID=196834 RepID=UPI0015F55755|nr:MULTISPECIES: HlyD family efflux transporter periplasmic adaptor subunit [unclassified Colwellia]MBA6257675.1 HlyD family efflux transporter periplasmic adaptor subunit [Colwellia sp. MB3u-28]MBA6259432.1 HlyD family efflux transporter periplasmic adaptor subunit [Colwellia sp. MB3u-41]MBA6304365.1 HlyD family efflux transporter periplasmic adaptor subunit [Colwellia sp. MB02u-14]